MTTLLHEEIHTGETQDEAIKRLQSRLATALVAADNWAADNRRWAWGDSVDIVMTEVYKLRKKVELALESRDQYSDLRIFSDSVNALIDGIYLQIDTPATSWVQLGESIWKDTKEAGEKAADVAKKSATWGVGGLALAAGLYFLLSRRF